MKKFLLIITLLLAVAAFAQEGDAQIVASINDDITVTLGELKAEVNALPEDQLNVATTKEGIQQILDQLIQRKLLSQKARSLQLDTVGVVQRAMKRSEDMILAEFLVMNLRGQSGQITEEQAQNFYTENESLFYTSPELELKQIVVATDDEAREVKGRLEGGESFDALMEEYPGVEGGAQSGVLGKLLQNQLAPNVVSTVSALDAGEWGGPIKTNSGFHFLYVISKKGSEKQEYENIKSDLIAQLTELKARNSVDSYIQSLVDDAKVTIDNAVLKEAVIQRQPQGAGGMAPSGN